MHYYPGDWTSTKWSSIYSNGSNLKAPIDVVVQNAGSAISLTNLPNPNNIANLGVNSDQSLNGVNYSSIGVDFTNPGSVIPEPISGVNYFCIDIGYKIDSLTSSSTIPNGVSFVPNVSGDSLSLAPGSNGRGLCRKASQYTSAQDSMLLWDQNRDGITVKDPSSIHFRRSIAAGDILFHMKSISMLNNADTLSLCQLFTSERTLSKMDSILGMMPSDHPCMYTPSGEMLNSSYFTNIQLSNLKVLATNLSIHPDFTVQLGGSVSDNEPSAVVTLKPKPDSVRTNEWITLIGSVPTHQGNSTPYGLSYLTQKTFHVQGSADSIATQSVFETFQSGVFNLPKDTSFRPVLGYFDVNRLQGNTTFLLSYGGQGGNPLYIQSVNTKIGHAELSQGPVFSPYGTVEVDFPSNSLSQATAITVRQANPTDYNLPVYNNLAPIGAVVEVLPSMIFPDSAKPRVKMLFSRNVITSMGVPVDQIRLYKPDLVNNVLVPLDGTLYSFLDVNGNLVSQSIGKCDSLDTTATSSAAITACLQSNNWSYLQVSATTKTFSVFAAFDKRKVFTGALNVALLPNADTSRWRYLSVQGNSQFHLYSIDSNYVPQSLPISNLLVEKDSIGKKWYQLPNKASSYVLFVPYVNGAELWTTPFVQSLTLYPEQFQCNPNMPPVAWLGLVNGNLQIPFTCSHPGTALLDLNQNGQTSSEVQLPLANLLVWNGVSGGAKVQPGNYTSRIIATDVYNQQQQYGGPLVSTDSDLPSFDSLNIQIVDSVLDKELLVGARVSDKTSGVDSLHLLVRLGDQIIVKDTSIAATPAITFGLIIPRSQIISCGSNCHLSTSLTLTDKGHNFTNSQWTSSSALSPYPMSIALWYPMNEGIGNYAIERLGTGYNLNIGSFSDPWRHMANLYFQSANGTQGTGLVLDSSVSKAITIEMRSARGYANQGAELGIVKWVDSLGSTEFELHSIDGSLSVISQNGKLTFPNILSSQMVNSHYAIEVDSQSVRIYVDGVLKGMNTWSTPWLGFKRGQISMGSNVITSSGFLGDISGLRLYRSALTPAQIAALSVEYLNQSGSSEVVIANTDTATSTNSASMDFSCSLPGMYYYKQSNSSTTGTVNWNPIVKGGIYVLSMEARGTSVSSTLEVFVDGKSQGVMNLAPDGNWNKISFGTNGSPVILSLSGGAHAIAFKLTGGSSIGGYALSSNTSLPATVINWPARATPSSYPLSVKTFYTAWTDRALIQPQMQILNNTTQQIPGFKIRYYFKGEDPSHITAYSYQPWVDNSHIHIVGQGSVNYVEFDYSASNIPASDYAFWGQAPYFGLESSYGGVNWYPYDDPSFEPADTVALSPSTKIAVISPSGKFLAPFTCFDEGTSAITQVSTEQVNLQALDARTDGMASDIYFKLQNVGTATLKDLEIRYYFKTDASQIAGLGVYDNPGQATTSLMYDMISGYNYVSFKYSNVYFAPNSGVLGGYASQFEIHQGNWTSWNSSDDPSHSGLGLSYTPALGMVVLDGSGNVIWGKIPGQNGTVADKFRNVPQFFSYREAASW